MAEADLRHVNVVWASPDPKDARKAESGGLTGGAPRAAFTAQAHEAFKPRRAGGYVTTAHA